MGFLDLFSKKQKEANQAFLAQQRAEQAISKIKKLNLTPKFKQQLIDAQIYDIWFSDKDLTPLAQALKDGEVLQYAAIGINDQSKDVLLACTDRNLLIVEKNKSEVKKIDLKEIKSVLIKGQLVYDELSLVVGNQTLDINSIRKAPAEILVKKIRQAVNKVQNGSSEIDQQVKQLKQLKELLDQGILTEEEFAAKKKKILDI